MKNLKKTLSLVLAMVMVFGMFAITANAAEVTDLDKVTPAYAEAVKVVNGMGIIEGDENGVFNPKGEITRAGAAKLVAYLTLGKTLADTLSKDVAPFDDVPAGEWYSGYVNYCAGQGYIDGNGDGTFDPEGLISGYGFAKLMLCAIGYGANDEYIGAGYPMNVAKDALKAGIFTGNLSGMNDTPATREEAALYLFNTLTNSKAGVVTYSKWLGDYSAPGATMGESLYEIKTVEGTVTSTQTTSGTKYAQVGDVTFEAAVSTDLYGHAVKVYYKDAKTIYAVVDKATNVATFVATDKTWSDTALAGKGFKKEAVAEANVSVNYADATTAAVPTSGIVTVISNNTQKTVDLVISMAETFEKVSKIETKAGKTYITTATLNAVETTKVEGANAVAKGDYVLVTNINNDAGYTVKKAEVVEGKATVLGSKSELTVAGTKYAKSVLANATDLVAAEIGSTYLKDNTTKLYLDSTGAYIVAVKVVAAEAAPEYVNVLTVYTVPTIDAYGNYIYNSYAQVATLTGEIETVLVEVDTTPKYQGTSISGIGSFKLSSDTAAAKKGINVFTKLTGTADSAKNYVTVVKAGTKFEAKTLSVKDADDNKVYITNDTKFLFVEGAEATAKVTVMSMPATTLTKDAEVIVAKDAQGNIIAKYVVVLNKYEAATVVSTDLIYLTDAEADGTTADGEVYKAFLNGEAVELVIDNAATSGLFPYTVDENGVYTLEPHIVADGTNVYMYETFAGLYGTKINSDDMVDIEAADAVIVDTVNTPANKISTLEGMLAAKNDGKTVVFHAVTTGTGASKKVTTIYIVNNAIEYAVDTYTGLAAAITPNDASAIEVVLTGDVTLTEALAVPAGVNVTLDLGGNTLTGNILAPDAELTIVNGTITNADATVSAIEINAGTLTLTDVEITSARHAVRVDGDAEVIIDGGTYNATSQGKTCHAVNVSGGATVTIKDGTFTGPKGTNADSGSAVNVQAGSTVIIEGGSFSNGLIKTLSSKGTLTVKGGTFDQDPSAYVADGYVATEADGTWTVAAE